MSSPNPPHSPKVEIFVNGAWSDISGDVYQRDLMRIEYGSNSESSNVQSGSATLTLDNRSRNYSFRNPNSTLFGQFKQNTPLRISNSTDILFSGEISSAKPSTDQSGKDLVTRIKAAGLLQRLRANSDPATSAPTSFYSSAAAAALAYWPLEDGPLSTSGAPLVGTSPLTHIGTSTQLWGQGQLAPWLPPVFAGTHPVGVSPDGTLLATLPAIGVAVVRFDLDFMFSSRGFSGPQTFSLSLINATDPQSADRWTISFYPDGKTIRVFAPLGFGAPTSVAGDTLSMDGNPHHCRLSINVNGSFADVKVYIDGALTVAGSTGNGTVGTPAALLVESTAGSTITSGGATIGHIAYWAGNFAVNLPPALSTANNVAFGRPGESAGDRLNRLCTENSVTLTLVGTAASTQPCGPQRALPLVDLLEETAAVDGGLLYETPAALGLTYRTRASIHNEAVTLALDAAVNHHLGQPLDPAEDDQKIRNDVTITRLYGGDSRVQQTTGPMSVSAPPTGVGRYKDSATLAVLFQNQAADHAGTRVLIGTWNEARYPAIALDLNTLPLAKRPNALAVTVGSRITIDNPPAWLPPDQIDLLVLGGTVSYSRFAWTLTFICVPFGPYRVAAENTARASSDGSTVTTTTTATSWSVSTPTGPLWITSAAFASQFPFDLRCEGERVTVTAISGGSSPQTFTVTRSVNGVVKAHTAAAVELWQPAYAAMGV